MTRGVGLGLGTHAPENLFCSSTWPAVVCEQSPDGGVMLLPLPLQMQSYQELRNRATASRPPTMAGRTRPCGAGQQASSGKRQGQSAEVERGAKKKNSGLRQQGGRHVAFGLASRRRARYPETRSRILPCTTNGCCQVRGNFPPPVHRHPTASNVGMSRWL